MSAPSALDRVRRVAQNDSVAYTGTHDNDTLRGWWETLPEPTRRAAREQIAAAGVEEDEPWWSLIRLTFSSPARLAMIQAQDVLGLGSDARMNLPGRATGSWRWRMAHGALTNEHAKRLRGDRGVPAPGSTVSVQSFCRALRYPGHRGFELDRPVAAPSVHSMHRWKA
ncbi:MAG TPA: 4-alpha-glucanotransferase [Solirubrobacteraceae bacterium]